MNQRDTLRLVSEMTQEVLLEEMMWSDWDSLCHYANTPYGSPLRESYDFRGQILAESLLDSLSKVFSWTKEKMANAMSTVFDGVKSLGGKFYAAFQKIIAKIFETMQAGKEAFEFVTTFSMDMASKIKEKFLESMEELQQWTSSMKQAFYTEIFEAAKDDPEAMAVIEKAKKEEGSADGKKVESILNRKSLDFLLENDDIKKEFIKDIKRDPTAAAELALGHGRAALGQTVKIVVRTILKRKPEVIKKIREKLFSSDFMKGPKGNLIVTLINFSGISVHEEGSKIIELGAKLWTAIKNLLKGQVINVEKNDQNLINDELFPEILGSLIGGESVIEKFTRSILGDVTSIVEIFIAAIKQIALAIGGMLKDKFKELCSNLGIPEDVTEKIKEILEKTLNIATSAARVSNSTSRA